MAGLFLLLMALVVSITALCVLIYRQQKTIFAKQGIQQEMLAHLDTSLRELAAGQQQAYKRLDQLATDVLQRDIYKNTDERHQLAIKSARQGQTTVELMQRYGLSSEEAALIIAMHSINAGKVGKAGSKAPPIENANLADPSVAELI